jgi:hypothetical protein
MPQLAVGFSQHLENPLHRFSVVGNELTAKARL